MIVWNIFEDFVNEEKVKQIGISNIQEIVWLRLISDNSNVKFNIVQNRFYIETNLDKEIGDYCTMTGIIYQSLCKLSSNYNI